jgi:DNA-binding GntR family transcriptional regulator
VPLSDSRIRLGPAYATKTQLAAEALRETILSGRLQAGQRLILRELQEELGLSITPIREALKSLEAEGLVVDEPHKGMAVAPFDLQTGIEIYEVRALVEGEAARLTTLRGTDEDLAELERLQREMQSYTRANDLRQTQAANREFHMQIARSCGNRQLHDLTIQLWRRFPWGTLRLPQRTGEMLEEHAVVVETIMRRDPDAARTAMSSHLEHACRRLREHAQARPSQSDEHHLAM